MNNLLQKIKESLLSVLPITAIVLLLHFTIAPMSTGVFNLFIAGAIMLIFGMGIFTLGADLSMMPMGERIGSELIKSRNVLILVIVGFLMGFMIAIAEPDLQILAEQVPSIENKVLIITVAVGVGILVVLALLRIIFKIQLSHMLIILYSVIFLLTYFAPEEFIAVAFDAGGVTTGPIVVPYIMALGIGVAAVRGGKRSEEDSFGIVSLCLIGPIISVLILGILYNPSGGYFNTATTEINGISDIIKAFSNAMPIYSKEVAIALLPIIITFIIFQIIFFKLPKSRLIKMAVGVIYTYIGLVLFLTGVNVGFLPAGNYIGNSIGLLDYNWVLIPIGMIIGFFIVMAEPAVPVLNNQVEEITGGAISKKAMMACLSIGISLSVGLSMIRVLTGLNILYFILPGYAISLILSFFVPPIFTGIAFDSGAVASGPMAATFLLPFAMGATDALRGNILTDAFGLVSMVAMAPLITIQVLGVIYKLKMSKNNLYTEDVDKEAIEDIEIIDFEGDEL